MKTASTPLSIAIGGAAMLAIGMGIARFSYTPILPAMRADAGLTVVLAGYLATANYFGYLVGALWTMLARKMGLAIAPRKMLAIGLLLALATTLATAATTLFPLWMVVRFLSGVASAWLMIYASAIVLDASAAASIEAPSMLGVHYAGVGTGIVLSGLLVACLEWLGFDWRAQWIGEAMLILALCPLAWKILDAAPMTRPVPPLAVATPVELPTAAAVGASAIGWLIAAYFCAGLGYIVSATFLPSIAKQHPQLAGYASFGWILVGIAAIPSNHLWASVQTRIGHLPALMAAFALQAVGVALPAMSTAPLALLASAAILGGTFMGIVTIANAKARLAAPARTAEIVAAMTAAYGVGQIIGPIVAARLALTSGTFSSALWLSAGILGIGMLLLAAGTGRANGLRTR